jgi:hypothetical protein
METGAIGGQCGDYVHKIADNIPALGDTIQEKNKKTNISAYTFSQDQQVGDVIISKTNLPYGHVSLVTKVNGDGTVEVIESNYGLDEKVGKRTVSVNDSKITGIYRGAKLKTGDNINDDEFQGFADEQIALSAMPVQTRNSDTELSRALTGIRAGLKQGKTPYEIADTLTGYRIEKPDAFSNAIRNLMSQSGNIQANDFPEMARMINKGDRAGAISKLEKQITKETDTSALEATARYTYDLGPKIAKEVRAIESKFGIVAGNWNKVSRRVLADKDFQKVQSELVAYVVDWRKQMAGTATTDTEIKSLEALLPSVTDNPINMREKLKAFAEMNLNLVNSKRATYNLPKLTYEPLMDLNKRAELYINDPEGLR